MNAKSGGETRIGVSGWRYAPWRGVFYPRGLKQREELAYASRMFATVEINGSFYSLQRPSSYQSWRAETPVGFVFALKGSRYVTHMLRLKDVEVPLANFFASGPLALGEELGPILWQLPPSLPFDEERLDAFLSLLPRDTGAARALGRRHDQRVNGRSWLRSTVSRPLRHALEVRHPSFFDAGFVALLRRHGIALVVADTAGRWPLMEDVTADFMYLRLHGDKELYASGYDNGALARWAKRIDLWRHGRQAPDAHVASKREAPKRSGRDVYCYFDNDMKVHAPYDAARLTALLGQPCVLDAKGRFPRSLSGRDAPTGSAAPP